MFVKCAPIHVCQMRHVLSTMLVYHVSQVPNQAHATLQGAFKNCKKHKKQETKMAMRERMVRAHWGLLPKREKQACSPSMRLPDPKKKKGCKIASVLGRIIWQKLEI